MFYLEIAANTCTCKISINGLGIDDLDAKKVGCVQYPCNTELVGKANKVAVEVMPATLDLATLNKIKVDGEIKKYPDDGFIGPDLGDVITSFSLEQTIDMIKANPFANIADLVPFKITAEFDSEDAPSFEERLLKSKPIDNVEWLKDWAMKFRYLLETRNIDGLYELYEPKLLDYDIAYPLQKEPDNKVWFTNWMNNKIFPQTPVVKYIRDDIVVKKWCEGRIWEISLKNGSPLWTTEGLDGKRALIEIYVGMVDGKIKIVR
jgi:hypothetical protein